jgi:hypothetical protein
MPHQQRALLHRTPEGNLIEFRPRGGASNRVLPQFTWDQLEAQLSALRPDRAALARRLVAVLRSRSDQRSSDDLLREMLCTIWTVLENAEA